MAVEGAPQHKKSIMKAILNSFFDLRIRQRQSKSIASCAEANWAFSNKYWISKDGREIKITELGNEHLINIILMLEQQAQRLDRNVGFVPNDKGVNISPVTALAQLPIYVALRTEAVRRKLMRAETLETRRRELSNALLTSISQTLRNAPVAETTASPEHKLKRKLRF